MMAYCGAMIQVYEVGLYPREVESWYSQGQICGACLKSPDYAMYLLGRLDDE